MNNFILIILLAAFPPLSTDMYLPAIPTLCTIWGITLVGMFFSTGALLILGKATPMNFALSLFAYSLFLGMGRPITNHLILKQVGQDTGTASSPWSSSRWTGPPKPMAIAVMGLVGSTIPFAAILAMQRGK